MGAEGARTSPSGREITRSCRNEDCTGVACGVTDEVGGTAEARPYCLNWRPWCRDKRVSARPEGNVRGPRVHPCRRHLKETIGECFHDLRQEKISETEPERQAELTYFTAVQSSDLCRVPSSKGVIKTGSRKSHTLDNGFGTP